MQNFKDLVYTYKHRKVIMFLEKLYFNWKSARYTKEDKPLNAYDTLFKFYSHLKEHVLPILEKMNINYSNFEKDDKVVNYVKELGEPSIEDIKNELINYIRIIN